jgi:UDP-glucose:(glucosyl)LPS alpha-1,2-glucosyltransferase
VGVEWNETSAKANGGTELMGRRLERSVSADLLDNFQIILTRVASLDNAKYRILWVHDHPEDPTLQHLANGGWRKFHRIVFVSNWQAQRFIERYRIPWSKCVVLLNAIEPIAHRSDEATSQDEKIKLVYHTTPSRGLALLLKAFEKLLEQRSNIELHLFSSFGLYGWQQRDEEYKVLFEWAEKRPSIVCHGAKSNETVREVLRSSHIFAYPAMLPETSCLCLMEAMSAGLQCVHPNLGALYETAANWTYMYHWQEDPGEHVRLFYRILNVVIETRNDEQITRKLLNQKSYADVFYNWEVRAKQWEAFLKSVVSSNEPKEIPRDARN